MRDHTEREREARERLTEIAINAGMRYMGERARFAEQLDALRAAVSSAVLAEVRAKGTGGFGVVNADGKADTRVFVGSDAPSFAVEHAGIVNNRESARGKPWEPAEVVVIPLAALTALEATDAE